MFCCICFSNKGIDDPRSPLTNANINSTNYIQNPIVINKNNNRTGEIEVTKLPTLVPITSPSVFSDAYSDRL